MLTLIIIMGDEWVIRRCASQMHANEIIAEYSRKKFAAFLYDRTDVLISSNVAIDLDVDLTYKNIRTLPDCMKDGHKPNAAGTQCLACGQAL